MFTDTHSAPQAPNKDSLWDSSFVAQNYFCWGGGKKEGARDRKGISHCDEERTTVSTATSGRRNWELKMEWKVN